MDSLFHSLEQDQLRANAPLAYKVRPQTLDAFVGQEAAVGEGSWLKEAIEHDVLSSVILFGPAGTGKTTLARIVAAATRAEFVEVSAIGGTVKDLRAQIDAAKQRLLQTGRRTILFVDEIHRFNRAQQDSLLHAVEERTVVLIGATTENPYFEVNSALISRSRIVVLEPLTQEDIMQILSNALVSGQGLNGVYTASKEVLEAIAQSSAGDARAALTTLELAAQLASDGGVLVTEAPAPIEIALSHVETVSPSAGLPYDKDGDNHYDVISAFIKSMRGSDPDAALYWLARMIAGGEDPRFIARRIMICASEDIGNADPHALLIAQAAFKAAEVIGYPECRINLAQAAVYLALAPKSNAVITGIDAALQEVEKGGLQAVPSHLRDRHRPGSKEYGAYKYPHNYALGYVDQRYLPDDLKHGAFWQASARGWEALRMQELDTKRSKDQPKGLSAE